MYGRWDGKGKLSSDLQSWDDYNLNRKRIRKEMQSNCVQGIQGGMACLRLNVKVRGKRIGCWK